MQFTVVPAHQFLEQLNTVHEETKEIIKSKIILLKENPFRFKRLAFKGYALFRIRISDNRKELRLIYYVEQDNVFLVCLLDRKKGYDDLREYLKRLSF